MDLAERESGGQGLSRHGRTTANGGACARTSSLWQPSVEKDLIKTTQEVKYVNSQKRGGRNGFVRGLLPSQPAQAEDPIFPPPRQDFSQATLLVEFNLALNILPFELPQHKYYERYPGTTHAWQSHTLADPPSPSRHPLVFPNVLRFQCLLVKARSAEPRGEPSEANHHGRGVNV